MKRFFTRCPAVLGLILLLATACQTEIERGETAVSPTPTAPTISIPTNTATTQPTVQTQPIATAKATVSPTATPFVPPDIHYLQAAIEHTLADFSGVASFIIIDLQTGEQVSLNPDVALAGTSLIKIPLLVETFRALDRPPDIEQTKLLTQTTSVSSNFAANLLLRDVVGGGDIFSGADALTQSMRNLGLYNTFIAVPYNLEPPPGRQQTYLTPANQRTDLSTRPDPYRQTTLGDLARLLTEIYSCAQSNSGLLREVYPEQIMQNECQEILRLLELNELARLLQNGLPENVTFSHKVGWIDDTHGNIGIVFGPERPYLIGMALYAPGWLEWEESAPLFEAVSRLTYNHFNQPDSYPLAILAQPPQLDNTPTPAPTPIWPQAIVFGTQGIGLTLRNTPGGVEITILPEGTVVSLLPDATQDQGGISWRKIRTPQGEEGWVGNDFLAYNN